MSDCSAFQGISRGSSPMSDRSGKPFNKTTIGIEDPLSPDIEVTVRIQPSAQSYLPSKYDRSL